MSPAPSRDPSSRSPVLLPGLLFLLLVTAVYADPLFLRRNFSGRDLTGYMLPIEKSIHDAYARGRIPVWISEISGGRPLAANPNAGAFYPVRIAQAVFPFPLAMRIFPILHWMLAGLGMLLLLACLPISRAGCWLGAVTYAFSAVSVGEVFFPNIQPGMALLPWTVWAIARPATPERKVFLLAIFFGIVLLAGDVFTAAIALGACALWILYESPAPRRARDAICLASAVLLGAMLAAPQILATFLWIPETNRAVTGLRVKEALYYTLSPFRLAELVVPFPFGPTWSLNGVALLGWRVFGNKPMGFFASLYSGAFAVIAVVATWKLRSPGARFGRALLLASLAVSILPSFVPRSWGDRASVVPLRYPEKFVVATVFALAVLAGIGWDRLRGADRLPRWLFAVGALLTFLAAAAALFPGSVGRTAALLFGGAPDREMIAGRQLSRALAEGALLWVTTLLALLLRKRPGRVGLPLALLLLTAVPIAASRRIAPSFPRDEVFEPTPFARFVSTVDPAGEYRTLGESPYRAASRIGNALNRTESDQQRSAARDWSKYTQAVWNRGTIFNLDFDRGDLSRLESLRRFLPVVAARQKLGVLFGSLALKFGIRYRDQAPLPGYRRVAGDAVQDWDEHVAALPDIRLVEKWREAPGGLPALSEMERLERGEIVVETGRLGRGTAPAGEVWIVEKSPERLRIETRASGATWLFVLRGYWTHRTVLLDDAPVEALPAQLAFSAVAVPAGTHRIDWRERLPGSSISRWGPGLFVLSGVLLMLRERRST